MFEFIKRMAEVSIVPTINLPTVKLGKDGDVNKVYMGIFKSGRGKKPYIVYSAGIGDCINFELDLLNMLKQNNIEVELFAIDPTPKALEFLSQQDLPDNFHVLPYALSDRDSKLDFALPQSDGWISGSAADVKQDSRNFDFNRKIQVEGRTIESIMKELGHNGIDLLKMDIEGSEFDVLEEALNKKLNIIEMCVDHHEYMLKHGRRRMIKLLSLLKGNYDIICTEDSGNKNFCCILKEH